MKEIATIDRIEGEYAVCELLDGNMVDIPLKQFKERPSEGDIFNIETILDNGNVIYNIYEKNLIEMETRRRIILEKINRIKKWKKYVKPVYNNIMYLLYIMLDNYNMSRV